MPKTETQHADRPVTVHESHVDFVLIGPKEGGEKVLVQSKNSDLLLLGMARVPSHLVIPRNSAFSKVRWDEIQHAKSIPGLYADDPDATLYSVTATAKVNAQPDARDEPFTFAWIGRDPKADLEPILHYFRNCVVSLHQAAQEEGSAEEVRWHLAPLLLLCAKWTKTTREAEDGNDLDGQIKRGLLLLQDKRPFQFAVTMMAILGALVSVVAAIAVRLPHQEPLARRWNVRQEKSPAIKRFQESILRFLYS